MVQVAAPPGWKPPAKLPPEHQGNGPGNGKSAPAKAAAGKPDPSGGEPAAPPSAGTADQAAALSTAASTADTAKDRAEAPSAPPKKAVPPPLPLGSAMLAAAVRNAPDGVDLVPPPPIPQSGSWLGRLLASKAAVGAAAGGVGLAVAAVVWAVFLPHSGPAPAESEIPAEPQTAAAGEPTPPPALPKPVPSRLDRRWLPDRTRLVVSLRISALAGREPFDRAVAWVDPAWRPSVARVLAAFGLPPKAVRRLTWASTDLAAWSDRAVVVIELDEGQHAGALAATGDAVELSLAGRGCRRLAKPEWSHPFAVLDEHTIVTGHEDLLRPLAARSEPHLESKPVERLLRAAAPEAELLYLVDLGAARQAGWNLPLSTMDVWPAGQRPWHAIWEVPQGLGLALCRSDRLVGELALACDGETAALKVRDALAELARAAKDGLAAQEQSLTKNLEAGRLPVAAASAYQTLLGHAKTALEAARWEAAEDVVWLRVDSGLSVPALVLSLGNNRPAMLANWLAAARAADEAKQRGLLVGLLGYDRAESRFPAGAEGGAVLPPETRLSWIATLLPYYGHLDWHRELQYGYSWNAPQNRPVTERPLPAVINPALGPSRTESGFPVTHYVGVSGIGPDAGKLSRDDPRAGVFGHGQSVQLDRIGDGASNTIATLGVSGRLGAWAAGGDATVRSLTRRPYVNGPDGFGSGQPDGMLAGMADGSVRFLSKDIDPTVLEQLVTINGKDCNSAVSLAPRPGAPAPAGPSAPAAAQTFKPVPAREEKPKPAEPDKTAAAPPSGGRNSAPKATAEPLKPSPAAHKPPAKPVDVQARLADRLPAIDFAGTPLADVIGLVSQMTTLRIRCDLEAMGQLGVRLGDPVKLRLEGATVDEILREVLAGRGLCYLVDRDQLWITVPDKYRSVLRTERYPVADLAREPADLAALSAIVEKLVAPDSWQAAGGKGAIAAADGALGVSQTELVHYQVLTFCEKLCVARGIPTRNENQRERFALATRLDRARPRLAQPITLNYEQAPLEQILADLAGMSRTWIVVDWLALQAERIGPQPQGTVKVENQPLGQTLGRLLSPLGLGCRIVGTDTLEVTSRRALGARLELEFYPAADLVPKTATAAALAEQIKGRVGGDTWNDAGGPALLHFDEPSRTLIVLQSQPNQIAIQLLLAELRTRLAAAEPKK